MEIAEFVEVKRPRWAALERLLDKAETGGLKTLNLDEARALSRLYRGTSSDLLWVRARAGSADVNGYLNDLVARAYALTYPGRRVRLSEVTAFLTTGFPDLLKREWRPFMASLLVLGAGAVFGWVGMVVDPDAALYLVDPQHLHLDPLKRAAEEAKNEHSSVQMQAAFSSFLFTHNIGVAFFTFALGISAGVGSALMLFITGILLGSLAWVYASKGMMGWFWAWILPHGIPEITAICIAGAAGFVIARGMIAPKGLSRRSAVRLEAVTAVKLLLGTLALFVLAGFIEGTISQIHPPRLSVELKVTFAALVGAGVYAYLTSGFLRRADGETVAAAGIVAWAAGIAGFAAVLTTLVQAGAWAATAVAGGVTVVTMVCWGRLRGAPADHAVARLGLGMAAVELLVALGGLMFTTLPVT